MARIHGDKEGHGQHARGRGSSEPQLRQELLLKKTTEGSERGTGRKNGRRKKEKKGKARGKGRVDLLV